MFKRLGFGLLVFATFASMYAQLCSAGLPLPRAGRHLNYSALATDPTGCPRYGNNSISPWRQAKKGLGTIDMPKPANGEPDFKVLPVLNCKSTYVDGYTLQHGCGLGAPFTNCRNSAELAFTNPGSGNYNPYAQPYYIYSNSGCSWQLLFSFSPDQDLGPAHQAPEVEYWFNYLAQGAAEDAYMLLTDRVIAAKLGLVVNGKTYAADIREVSQTALYTIFSDPSKYFVGQMAQGYTATTCPTPRAPLHFETFKPIPDPIHSLFSTQSGVALDAVRAISDLQQTANYRFQSAVIVNMLANYASAYFLQQIWTEDVSADEHNASARSITDVVANTLAYGFELYQRSKDDDTITTAQIRQFTKIYEQSLFTRLFDSIYHDATYTSDQRNGIQKAFCSIRPDQFEGWGGNSYSGFNYADYLQRQVEQVTTTDDTNWNDLTTPILEQTVGDMSAIYNTASGKECPLT